ncbi:DMT family transporter [Flavobacterium sp. NRK F7]|uniref:DMT family transporter n=1 Tax=Flavobacterium sp. NRK F7 TaxID=2954930 RepID=UPI002090ABB5|nr:DMT family transporter [Flavobacterium sp. NRK F7]MCO6161597.1 DMT family transporter [Flavobacterium sp. NRK F7]
MSKRSLALLGATFVALIYGANFTIAKDVMPTYVQPYAFILIRVIGASILFWSLTFFGPKEKIALQDFPRIIAASLFGVVINQLSFFKGLSYTSPISASVIMVTAPIVVLILSAILLREKIELKKVLGILIGLTGTSILILYGKDIGDSTNAGLGNFLVFVNASSYAVYLIIVKKLISKYHAFTFIKWIYTFGLLFTLPFAFEEFKAIQWESIPINIYYNIGFVVLFTTFFAYLINLMAMKELKPTTLSVFIYLQPLFATIIAISLQKDELNNVKLISALLIFIGVYLVTQKKAIPKK